MSGFIHWDGNFISVPWVAAVFIIFAVFVIGLFIGNALTIWQAGRIYRRSLK